MAELIEGKVVAISPQGNLITDITIENLAGVPRDDTVSVLFDAHRTQCILSADHGEPDSTLVAFVGESGSLEISIVGISLSEMLNVGIGESVQVKW